jgi:hypothetical protein
MACYNGVPNVKRLSGESKRVIGDGLRSRIYQRRSNEIGVAVDALNHMLEMGHLNYVRAT